MKTDINYIEINRASWNKRTDYHLQSEFYDLEGFMNGKSSLNDIELSLLGDIKGKHILHLQCHFGQDSMSLARMGAHVVGVDLSDKAIESAQNIAEKLGIDSQFICCDIFDLPQYLNQKFDIVFTSYGVIGWLPDLDKWAKVIHDFLKPQGQLVFVEFHPVVWMFDDDFENVKYRYFNSGPIIETESGTYADKDANIEIQSVNWNHGLSEVVSNLLKNSLELLALEEYDYSPYNCFRHTVEVAPKKYRIEHMENNLPMVYSVLAKKKD